ncbi:MAG: MFS transporter [Rhizobiales bacterium]|nr:MFS transporter [Hyphomicrobiales bacterium]
MTAAKGTEKTGLVRGLIADAGSVSRDMRILLLGQFFMNASTFTAFPLMAVYMANHLHFGSTQIGTVLTLHLVGGRALPILTGPMADRFGFRPLMVIGLVLRAGGFIGFGLSSGFALTAFATLAIGLGTALYESAVYGIFGRQPASIVARVFVLNNLLLNLGVIVGPMLGALLLAFDPVLPFYASGIFFIVLALFCIRFDHLDRLYTSRSPILASWKAAATDRLFLLFLLATFAWWFLFSQLFVLFPLMAAKLAGTDAGASWVFTTNGIAGIACVTLSLVIFRWVSERRVLFGCYIALAAVYLIAGLGSGLWWLLGVVALYTVMETLILPAIEAITANLAHEGKQATFFGAIGVSWGIGGALGNYAGSWLAVQSNGLLIWGSLAAVAMIGAGLTGIFNAASLRPARTAPAPAHERRS